MEAWRERYLICFIFNFKEPMRKKDSSYCSICVQLMYNCKLDSLRGYSYKLPNSIINCPTFLNGGIIMPLANSIQFFDGVKSTTLYQTKRQIAAIDMRGPFIGIGEKASPGQLISAVLLDTRQIDKPKIFNYQKTQINYLAVSSDGEWLVTVGSSSEFLEELSIIEVNNQSEVGTKVYYFKVFKKKDGSVRALKFSNNDPRFFVLLCVNKVILYRIDPQNSAVEEILAKTSKVREFNNIIFSPDDCFLYGCSKNGDIAEVSVEQCKQTRIGPRKRVITKGITNIKFIPPNSLGICGKEGLIALIDLKEMQLVKQVKLQDDQIISITDFYNGTAYVATNKATIYKFDALTCDTELFYACHSTRINTIAFLKDFSQIFGTCSGGDVVIWKTSTLAPTIKISVPRLICLSLHFPKNGKYIITGWSDESIRIFSPKNGKLIHRIEEANIGKVTAIITDDDSTRMICGGQSGVIRMWNLIETKIFCLVLGSLAYHSRTVHCLKVNPYNPDQLVSACQDGCYAVWSLSRFELRSKHVISSFIKDIQFIDELTIRVVGSSAIITEVFIADGYIRNQIPVLGSSINTIEEVFIDITGENLLFYGGDLNYLTYFDLTSKNIQLVRIESFGQIVKMQPSPDKKHLIAVTANGIVLKYSIFAIKKNMKEEDSW